MNASRNAQAIDRVQFEELATGDFIRRRDNLVMVGQSGIGKTFAMPDASDVAQMIKADLADARRAWLKEAKHDPDERRRRQESDFLCAANHNGEVFDFHSLRHTYGAWLAMAGAHPKEVQSVVRHSTIVRTMDTYGHLFPGQDARTVARFPRMLSPFTEAEQATDTNGDSSLVDPKSAPRLAQQPGREKGQGSARPRDGESLEMQRPPNATP